MEEREKGMDGRRRDRVGRRWKGGEGTGWVGDEKEGKGRDMKERWDGGRVNAWRRDGEGDERKKGRGGDERGEKRPRE